MTDTQHTRRQVLRTTGLVGLGSIVGLTGLASAKGKPERKGNNFGNTNGLGVFLNEPALYKDSPVWSDGVHDYTGMENVTVYNNAMTSVNIPGFPIPSLPVAFSPMAIEVSPGTTVTFDWIDAKDSGLPFSIPHNVVSLREDENGTPEFAYPGKFDVVAYETRPAPPGEPYPPYVTADPVSFDVTFDEPGTHLYYCTPHGAPFEVFEMGDPNNPLVYNEFGMRGAVVVSDEE